MLLVAVPGEERGDSFVQGLRGFQKVDHPRNLHEGLTRDHRLGPSNISAGQLHRSRYRSRRRVVNALSYQFQDLRIIFVTAFHIIC